MAEFGIYCENRAALQERCFVSTGLTLLNPNEAERRGYLASEIAQIIVPATAPRPATTEELDAIIAGPDTRRLMQLSRLPRLIGEQLLQGCIQNRFDHFDEHTPYQEIAPGIIGKYIDGRFDDTNQLSLSVDRSNTNQFSRRLAKVGDHMDVYENPDVSLLIGNIGPGEHWHHLAPEFNRDSAGGPKISDRVHYIKSHPNPSSILVYWFKLKAPGKDYFEAILNSPVAWAMHDGSTLNCPEPSTAFFCVTDPIDVGMYPSLLAA